MSVSGHSRRAWCIPPTALSLVALLGMAGCSTSTAQLRQEVQRLLRQTKEELQLETNRLGAELAQIRAEVGQLKTDVGQLGSKMGRLGSDVGQLDSEVALLQSDVKRNNSSLVNLTVRVNQIDRRLAREGVEAAQPPPGAAGLANRRHDEREPASAASAGAPGAAPPNGLRYGMTEQDVLRLFGSPHGRERVLDSIYWYYADGELKGQYVRFDAATGQVSGWSSFSPQPIQLDFRTSSRASER